MLSLGAISETAISALPDGDALAWAASGMLAAEMNIAARLGIVSDFGMRPLFAVEITLQLAFGALVLLDEDNNEILDENDEAILAS